MSLVGKGRTEMSGFGERGNCSNCHEEFEYTLIHNGFNDSSYAYCDTCGTTAVLSGWYNGIPKGVNETFQGAINHDTEPFLESCECGGTFRCDAAPRCPHCNIEINATDAAEFIERNAPGTQQGWRWQKSWTGLYCIVVDGKCVRDNWKQI